MHAVNGIGVRNSFVCGIGLSDCQRKFLVRREDTTVAGHLDRSRDWN